MQTRALCFKADGPNPVRLFESIHPDQADGLNFHLTILAFLPNLQAPQR